MSNIYTDGRYHSNNPTWHSDDSPWKAKQIVAMLKKHGLTPRTVAEVGCGAGQVLNNLAIDLPSDVSLHGYDISPQAIEICQSIQNPRLTFYNKDFFLENENLFDAVLAIDVFEHVEDCFTFLRSFRTKGKYKIFHIPLEINAVSSLCGMPAVSRKKFGHLHFFNRETAIMALEETGYKIVDWVYTAGAIDLPQQSIGQALAFLPRILLGTLNKDMAQRLLGGWSLLVLAE
jgi:SAM-dependent methyltransferase